MNIDLTRKENHSRRNVNINTCLSYKSNWINLSQIRRCETLSSESLCPRLGRRIKDEDERGSLLYKGTSWMVERVGDTANKEETCR